MNEYDWQSGLLEYMIEAGNAENYDQYITDEGESCLHVRCLHTHMSNTKRSAAGPCIDRKGGGKEIPFNIEKESENWKKNIAGI